MQTADVFDRMNARRLSATLSFARDTAELIVSNGGGRAEELTIEAIVAGRAPRLRRERYCLDVGTSLELAFPLLAGEHSRDLMIAISGGPAAIVLKPPASLHVQAQLPKAAGALAAAAALVIALGATLAPDQQAYRVFALPAEREPVAVTVQKPAILTQSLPPIPSITIADASPSIDRTPIDRAPIVSRRTYGLRTAVARRREYLLPAPHMQLLSVPKIVAAGDAVPVTYRADATNVRIIATIGPTIVARHSASGGKGSFAIVPPQSHIDGRVMTVRAYAQRGPRTEVTSALVVLGGS